MADGFIRFACPCGRRLKVKAEGTPTAGKCPDCGRTVPIPGSSSKSNVSLPTTHHDAPTEELSATDVAMLEQWSLARLNRQAEAVAAPAAAPPPVPAPSPSSSPSPRPSTAKAEAGLRVCPRCGRPVHMGSVACRECGAHVPKR